MPKIKVKNIPYETLYRIYSYNSYDECVAFYKNGDFNRVIELSEADFPTNREWAFAGFDDQEVTQFLERGYGIRDKVCNNLYRMVVTLAGGEDNVEKWLSQPCKYLMEEE